MKKLKETFKHNNSGQLLIVAALAIAVLISSTTTYVYELSKETSGTNDSTINESILAIRQSTKNVMISSLANVSNGGTRTLLTENLNTFLHTLRNTHQLGICNLEFTTFNDSGYDEGTRLSWDTTSPATSSAYANFTLQAYGENSRIITKFAINVTTAVAVSGFYITLAGGEKNVSLTCNLKNEGEPALVKNLTVFYNDAGNWTQAGTANGLSVADYGNGTYTVSFRVVVADPVQVSVQILDLRNIFVRANMTCYAG